MATINLKRGDFLKRIADIENNPNQWQYLGERPALVDFYAPWCGPCRMLMPVLDELAKEYAGKVDIYKVNVEDEQQLAEEFGIRSIPTLLFGAATLTFAFVCATIEKKGFHLSKLWCIIT